MGTLWSEAGEHRRGLGAVCLWNPFPGSGAMLSPCTPCSLCRHEELVQKGGVYASMWLQQQVGDEGHSKEHRTEKPPSSKKGP